MAINSLYPTIRPSLLLDFANTKTLDPRITFSRASTAVFYDDNTVAKAEENLLEQSEAFDSGLWTKLSLSVTANTETAPNGTTTADTLTASAGTVRPYVVANNPTGKTVAGQLFVGSVFAKKGTHNFLQIAVNAQATDYANFNLDTGVVGTTGGTVTSSISSVGNGWYRCVLIYTPAGTINVPTFEMAASASATRGQSWTAAGTETIILWGAQLEQRSSVTAYTPTTTQPITNYIPVLQTAAANVARFDHNPVTRESLGLLVEEQRTNLWLRSEEFDNAAWTKNASSVMANTIVAPDGTLTGDKLVENSSSAEHYLAQSAAVTSGTTYVLSVFAKQAESGRYLTLLFGGGTYYSGEAATFNLSTGVVTNTAGTTSAKIESKGNGWYRCSITAVSKATGTPAGAERITINNSTSASVYSYTGDGYSGIYIWGAQLEAGAFPTSYIATSASQVTRAADSASMTGGNFTSWFNNAEGTFYIESATAAPMPGTQEQTMLEAGQTGNRNNRVQLLRVFVSNIARYDFVYAINNSAQCDLYATGFQNTNTYYKFIGAYKANDFATAIGGSGLLTDSSGSISSNIDMLSIGSTISGGSILNGTIKKLAFYPLRLSNTNLVALTQG